MPETQAKAFSTAVRDSHEAAELATKADLREYGSAIRSDLEKLEVGLRHEIGDLRKDLQHVEERFDIKLANLKFELLKWLIGLAIAQAGLLIGVLKFFPSSS